MAQPEKLTVEELVREIEKQLQHPKEGEFVAISSKIRELRRRKPRGPWADRRDRVEAKFTKLVEARGSKLETQVLTALEKFKATLAKGTLPQDDLTGSTRMALKELEDLDLARADVRDWRDTLNRLEREREDLAKVIDIERAVQEKWARAQSTEEQGGYGDSIVQEYKDASTEIQGYLKAGKISSSSSKQRLVILAAKAERLLSESANKHTLPLTRTQGNEVVTVFKTFLKQSKSNPQEPVTYFLTSDPDAGQGQLHVKDACEVAKEKVRQFWSSKVTEYVDLARHKLLDEHDPYGAQGQLDKWQDLEGLHDPELEKEGLALSGDPEVKIRRLQTEIDAKRKIRQDAEKFCRDAMNQGGLAQAYEALRSAIQADEHTPAIASTRKTLQERLSNALETEVESAGAYLNEGRWDEVDSALKTADAYSALDPTMNLGDRVKRVQQVRRTLEDVRQVIEETRKQPSPVQAKEKLDAFKKRYSAKQLEQWSQIREIEDDLKAQLGDRDLISEIRSQINTSATLEQLVQALEDWKRTRLKIQKEGFLKEFDALRPELDVYIAFRTAQDKKSTDLAAALDVLKSNVLNHPVLGADATQLRNELAALKEKQQDAKQALADIRKYVETDPRLARRKAIEWKNRESFYTSDFVDLEQQAQRILENQLTQALNAQLSKDAYSRQVRARIDALMTELRQIGSEKELEYRKKTELPCAIAEAEESESKAQVQKSGWEKVASDWKKAHDLAVEYRDDRADNFEKRRLEAYKKQVREKALSANTIAEQIDQYSRLNSEVDETDAEVWLWLGQAHLEAAHQMLTGESSVPVLQEQQ